MTVGTDQFAFRNFLKHAPATSSFSQISKVGLLLGSREVVPVHGDWVKGETTICTGLSYLEARVPRQKCCLSCLVLCLSLLLIALVVGGRIGLPTGFAPPLVVVVPAVEFREWFVFAASSTPPGRVPHFRIEHMFATTPVGMP
jgi:hypothetical protein